MAQVLVNFRLDEEDKRGMEEVCRELGMSMSTAFTIFAKKMRREKRIPFEVSVDPFYSDANISHLTKVISEIESGKANLSEHELILPPSPLSVPRNANHSRHISKEISEDGAR